MSQATTCETKAAQNPDKILLRLKEKLDVLMELAEIKHPELYNQYRAARIIVDRAA